MRKCHSKRSIEPTDGAEGSVIHLIQPWTSHKMLVSWGDGAIAFENVFTLRCDVFYAWSGYAS